MNAYAHTTHTHSLSLYHAHTHTHTHVCIHMLTHSLTHYTLTHSLTHSHMYSQRSMMRKMSMRRRKPSNSPKKKQGNKKLLTVSAHFRESLDLLMERLFAASPHFVRSAVSYVYPLTLHVLLCIRIACRDCVHKCGTLLASCCYFSIHFQMCEAQSSETAKDV